MCTNPPESVAYKFVPTSPAVHSISCSSYFYGLWDGRKVAVHLLFCRVLLPSFAQNSMQHSSVVPIKPFFLRALLKSRKTRHLYATRQASEMNRPFAYLGSNISSTQRGVNRRIRLGIDCYWQVTDHIEIRYLREDKTRIFSGCTCVSTYEHHEEDLFLLRFCIFSFFAFLSFAFLSISFLNLCPFSSDNKQFSWNLFFSTFSSFKFILLENLSFSLHLFLLLHLYFCHKSSLSVLLNCLFFYKFFKLYILWNANCLVQDLNLGRWVHFRRRQPLPHESYSAIEIFFFLFYSLYIPVFCLIFDRSNLLLLLDNDPVN